MSTSLWFTAYRPKVISQTSLRGGASSHT